ncbi:hypothetical protein [Nocardia sp. NPDC050406]|uniref:hypothetical protein n=1 Tax=Nocardia sp. NPDC050406 TaxID=3364318 RepID=UPI0037AECF52
MGDTLRADLDALRVMAAGLRAESDAISAIDPIDLIAKAARAMSNSAIGVAAAGVNPPLRTAVHDMAEQLRTMADTAEHSATTYEAANRAFTDQLDEYLHGTP